MFVHVDEYRYPWPVEVLRPSQTKPGIREPAGSFMVTFRMLSEDAWRKLDEEFAALPANLTPDERKRWQHYALKAACVDWSDYSFDGVTPAPFTTENFARALEDLDVAAALLRAWTQSRTSAFAGN